MKQKDIVNEVLKGRIKASISEIETITKLPNPTIRRILGQGAKSGELERIAKGVYTLKTNRARLPQ